MIPTIQSRIFRLLACCLKNVNIRIYNTIILPLVLYGCETWSHNKGGTVTEGELEQGAENIWTEQRQSDRTVGKIAQ
jgi:hypothetical protein